MRFCNPLGWCLEVSTEPFLDTAPVLRAMPTSSLQVFARTMFFLRHEAFTTPRCVATTVNPCFDSTFRVSQIITEDFLIYLDTDALELQVQFSVRNSMKLANLIRYGARRYVRGLECLVTLRHC